MPAGDKRCPLVNSCNTCPAATPPPPTHTHTGGHLLPTLAPPHPPVLVYLPFSFPSDEFVREPLAAVTWVCQVGVVTRHLYTPDAWGGTQAAATNNDSTTDSRHSQQPAAAAVVVAPGLALQRFTLPAPSCTSSTQHVCTLRSYAVNTAAVCTICQHSASSCIHYAAHATLDHRQPTSLATCTTGDLHQRLPAAWCCNGR